MADDETTTDGEDALAGDVDIKSGDQLEGGGGGLPDEGIKDTDGGTGEGEAGPASGTTEGDDAVGIV